MTDKNIDDVAERLRAEGLPVDAQDVAEISERWREQLEVNARLRSMPIPFASYGLAPRRHG